MVIKFVPSKDKALYRLAVVDIDVSEPNPLAFD